MTFIKFQKTQQDTKNIIDYTKWTVGQTSASGFSRNGLTSENLLVNGIDPFGNETVLWEAKPSGSDGADGGWNGSTFSINNTKMYRFSVWVKRTVYIDGRFYFGLNGYGSVNGVLNRSNGSNNTNPYSYVSGDPPAYSQLPNNVWVLAAYHVWPAGSGTGSSYADTGLYTILGGKYAGAGDFVWRNETTSARHRTYLFYSADKRPRQYWCYPRVDIIDGNEPKITDLLLGYGATTDVDNATKNGNFFLGNDNKQYGPTRITGFYAGIAPVDGGYTVYKYSGGLYPKIYAPRNGDELVDYLRKINVGFNGSSVNEALAFAENNDNLFITQN